MKYFCSAVLIIICAGSISLAIPTFHDKVNNLNINYYFYHDEGGLQDLGWYYYSGERRQTSTFDFDYGIELLYLTNFLKLLPSNFMVITSNDIMTFVRGIHLMSWVAAMIALWSFVGRHFSPKGWPQVLAVMLLAVRPAFAQLMAVNKPEPLILLVMILGMDYTLRMVEEKTFKHFIIAVSLSALAFSIKYAGLFMWPPLLAGMYLTNHYKNSGIENHNDKFTFPIFKYSYVIYSLMGVFLVIAPLIAFTQYVRMSTGHTWYADHGLWGSMTSNRFVIGVMLLGILLVMISLVIAFADRVSRPNMRKVMTKLNEINSYLMIIVFFFSVATLFFCMGWLIEPKRFVIIYSQLPLAVFSGWNLDLARSGDIIGRLVGNLTDKVTQLDPIIIFTFIFYIFIEFRYIKYNLSNGRVGVFKRLILLVFVLAFMVLNLFPIRMQEHHMLPFFVMMSVLSIQGLSIFMERYEGGRLLKILTITAIIAIFMLDIGVNGQTMVQGRLYTIKSHKDDIAFEIERWFLKNIPVDAKIVSDHPIAVYLPPEYKNVRTVNSCAETDPTGKMRELVMSYKPQYVYYNIGKPKCRAISPAEEFMGDRKVRLVKVFDNSGMDYQVNPNSRFVLYSMEE